MPLKQWVQDKYQRHAKFYDFSMHFYRLIGFRHKEYRLRAVELLRLQRGDRVVDLGCGTGLSFSLILKRIGPEGRLIGVDLTPAMLAYARERVERAGWNNVELVRSDIAAYDFPKGVNGVLSIGAFGFVAEYEQVIEKASHALVPGGRLVIMDGKQAERWPLWLLKLFVRASRPFGLTLGYFEGRPWESVERFFLETTFEEKYGGLLYISAGTAASPSSAMDSQLARRGSVSRKNTKAQATTEGPEGRLR